MIFYLVSMIDAFVPAALLLGMLLARAKGPAWRDAWVAGAGLAGAGLAQKLAAAAHATTQTGVTFALIALGCGLILAGSLALQVARRPSRLHHVLPVVLFFFCLQAMADFLGRTADRTMSSTMVVNTEMILNIAAMAGGAVLTLAVFWLSWHAAQRIGRAAIGLALAALCLDGALWGTQAALGLLQLGSIEATGGRLTFVAQLTRLAPFAPYAQLSLAGILAGLSVIRRPRPPTKSENPAEARKQVAFLRVERRWRHGLATLVGLLLVLALYNDLYASAPPRLSPAALVTPDAHGEVRIHIDDVRDGRLHRYAYISQDGHRVRFFLINRFDPDHAQIGVVYDACKLCGDQGYVQKGNEIICIACNVRIFAPSIGKPGGCNPIPLPHQTTGDEIVVTAAALERGAGFFSETVDIKVKDPVTGADLVNTSAPFKYEEGGRVFYFESQASFDAFRQDPARYAGEPDKRGK